MTIKVLDSGTIRSIHSGQVISDLESIVKELLENSLDAHATSIELVFTNNGFESLQLKDDGDGIEQDDRSCVAKRHYTSKIKQFKDLESIETYGFRGEGMNSIVDIADKFVLTTKTKQDVVAKQYDVDRKGNISNEKPVNVIPKSGTIIQIIKPFYHLAVRRQVAQKNASANMKKIQELLTKYALAHPQVRFSLLQKNDTAGGALRNLNSNNTWIKPVTSSVTSTLGILFGAQFNDMVERFIETDPEHDSLTVDVILPKSHSDPSVILKGPDRIYIYANQRPINYVKSELKELVSTIKSRYYDCIGLSQNNSNKKPPFMYIDVQLPPNEYDVNLEPNKTTVLFHNKQRVINLIEKQVLDKLYPSKSTQFFTGQASQAANGSVEVEAAAETPATLIPAAPADDIILMDDHHVNVAQQPEEPPLFMQQNNPIVVPTEFLAAAPLPQQEKQQQQKNWAFSMMDDEEFDELVSDDENSSDIAKSSSNAAFTHSNNATVTRQLSPQQQPIVIKTTPTLEQFLQPTTTNIPTTTTAAEREAAAAKTAAVAIVPPELQGWQIDDSASAIIENGAVTPADPQRTTTTTNGRECFVHTSTSHLVEPTTTTYNKQRTINDALQFDGSTTPTSPALNNGNKHRLSTKVFNGTEKLIPKKRTIQLDDEMEQVESTSTIAVGGGLCAFAASSTQPLPPQKAHQKQQQIIHTQQRMTQQTSPCRQTPPLIPSSSAQPTTPPRHRDIASLFNMPSSSSNTTAKRKAPNNGANLCNTLNQAIRIDCSMEEIKSNYPLRKDILAETYRIRIHDYLTVNDYGPNKGQVTSLFKTPPNVFPAAGGGGAGGQDGLAFYTRGNPSTVDKCRHQIFELGVVRLKQLYIESITNRLAREYKMVVKKLFERPVQIQISHQDGLCPVLLSLKSKEQLIPDDMHGQRNVTYSEIIEDNILYNGFRVRWRKDLMSDNLIVQFTGIYSLGSGYGPSDFRELLSLIAEAAAKSAITKVASCGKVGGSNHFVRPTKVMHHLKRLAEEMYQTNKQNQDVSIKELERALDGLNWKRDTLCEEEEGGEGSDWQLGYASATSNKVLACMLASPQISSQE